MVKIKTSIKTGISNYTVGLICATASMNSVYVSSSSASPIAGNLANIEHLTIGANYSNLSVVHPQGFPEAISNSTTYADCYIMVMVEKGVPVYFLLSGYNANTTFSCNNIQIYADEV